MKKLLCLICALLVLSVPLLAAAQGEAQRTRLTFSADWEQLAEYLRLLDRFSEKEQRSFGKGLAELLNGLEITSDADGAASATGITLKGEELFGIRYVQTDPGVVLMQMSLLPSYTLRAEVGLDAAQPLADALEVLQNFDWESVSQDMEHTRQRWLAGTPCTEEYGSFVGDAYTGGTRRVTYEMDWRDVSLLLECLLDDCAGLFTALEESGVTAPEEASSAGRLLRDAALANPSSYTASVVYNDQDSPVGISLLVYSNGVNAADIIYDEESTPRAAGSTGRRQVASLSVGLNDPESPRVVLGLGLPDGTLYLDVRLYGNADGAAVSADIYRDSAARGFPAVSAGEPQARVEAEVTQEQTQTSATADFNLRVTTPGGMVHSGVHALTLNVGSAEEKQTVTGTTWVGENETPAISWKMEREPADVDLSLDAEGRTTVDFAALTDPDHPQYSEVMGDLQSAMISWSLKLMQVIPRELMTMLTDLMFDHK